MNLYEPHVQEPVESEEDIGLPGTRVRSSCEQPCRGWNHQVLLIDEPSLHPQESGFFYVLHPPKLVILEHLWGKKMWLETVT